MDFVPLTAQNIDSFIANDELPLVVDFWANWSTACLMYKEKLEFAREILEGMALFGSVDIDEAPDIAERYSIITIPTTLIFWKGAIVKQYIGIQEHDLLENVVMDLIEKDKPKSNN